MIPSSKAIQPKPHRRARNVFAAFAALAIAVASALLFCCVSFGSAQALAPTNTPGLNKNSMSPEGNLYVIGLRIDFPDYQFAADDTLQALQNIIGAEADSSTPDVPLIIKDSSDASYPYENLGAYYYRASYGKLVLKGRAYNYTATHNRDYYTYNLDDLVAEALAALDSQIDYSLFDGDSDGYIDAVYLHFAGPNTGWGTTWWSEMRKFHNTTGSPTYDGKQPFHYSPLHSASNNSFANRTMIHETGHMLGLWDMYWSPKGIHSGRTGSLTWDMMDNSTGDINGFSKWLIGWIDENQIIRVVANKTGTTAYKGTEQIAHMDAAADGTSSLDLLLNSFDSNTIAECGGFIIVSNANEGRYASYYLIQYETPSGNQSITYEDSRTHAISSVPSGFRVYRINAQVNSQGSFTHSEGDGLFGQVVSLVDADYSHPHNSVGSPSSTDSDYGCLLYAGKKLDYSTRLSTNLWENIHTGFTGITIEALSCDAASGSIRIGYSPEGKPSLDDFALTCDDPSSLLNSGTVTFSTPWAIENNPQALKRATLTINGETFDLYPQISGTTITLKLDIPAYKLQENCSATLTFAEGAFIVGAVDGSPLYSKEMTFVLNAAHQAVIEKDSILEGVSSGALSSCVQQNGIVYTIWLQYDYRIGYTPMLVTFPSDNPNDISISSLEGLTLPENFLAKAFVGTLSIYAEDKAVLVLEHGESCLSPVGTDYYWIDLKTGRVSNHTSISSLGMASQATENGTLYVFDSTTNTCYRLTPVADSNVVIAQTSFETSFASLVKATLFADKGKVALFCRPKSGYSAAYPVLTAYIVNLSAFDGFFDNKKVIEESILQQATLQFRTVLPIFGYPTAACLVTQDGSITGLLVASIGRVSIIGATMYTPYFQLSFICVNNKEGVNDQEYILQLESKNPDASSEIIETARIFNYIAVSENGQIAIMRNHQAKDYNRSHETILLNLEDMFTCKSSYECGRYLCTDGGGLGLWTDSNTWLALDYVLSSKNVHCYLIDCTRAQPDQPVTPEPEGNLPRTADPAPYTIALALFAFLASVGILTIARKRC